MSELINVSKLERRVQRLENSLSVALKLLELHEIRLDVQLSRITEVETLVNLDPR